MKVLFIGGTGIISSACSQLCLNQDIDLYLFNRGQSFRPVPEGAKVIQGDIRNPDQAAAALEGHTFDAVVNWIAFTTEHVQTDLRLFKGRTGQYIFISSASVYQTPPSNLPVSESTPLDNPKWAYSRAKIACEELLVQAYRQEKFPMTIVRPSHTYDKTLLPFQGGWTVVDRMRQGKKVIVHGDGSSLWVLTHHIDFARGFLGLLGNARALGDSVHITSDELLTWNQIFQIVGRAAGVEPKLVHVPSELIAAYDDGWGASLLGDKTHSMIFDNSKIKRLTPGFAAAIPFSRGAEEIIAWYDANPERRQVSEAHNSLCDQIITAQENAYPKSQ
jgi:nucleoside-diphosphate-sugar epimerase